MIMKENPLGPADSYDPDEPNVVKRVVRGGSFLCRDQYCIRSKSRKQGERWNKERVKKPGFSLCKRQQVKFFTNDSMNNEVNSLFISL